MRAVNRKKREGLFNSSTILKVLLVKKKVVYTLYVKFMYAKNNICVVGLS